jgi:hypothetical protein
MKMTTIGAAMLAAVAATGASTVALAQEAGVVTAVEGRTTLVRARASMPLEFKAPVFVHDRITTADQAFARLLLGGRAVVTVRERSIVTITDVPGKAVINVGRGRVAVSVAKDRMQPGESVEIQTPNAAAGIRGTVVVAEVSHGADGPRSAITVLRGLVEVSSPAGGSMMLGPLDRARFVGALAPVAERITQAAADALGDEFRVAPAAVPAVVGDAMKDMLRERTLREAMLHAVPRPPLRARLADRADEPSGDTTPDAGDEARRIFARFGRPEHIVATPRVHDIADDGRHGPRRLHHRPPPR